MKILQVVSGANEVAGVQKHAGFLAQSSCHEHLVATFPSKNYENWLAQNKIQYVVVKSQLDMIKVVESFKPDVLHAHLGKALLQCFLVKFFSRKKIKLVYTQHIFSPASESAPGFAGKVKRLIVRAAESNADSVIAVSKAVERQYQVRAPQAKLQVIYNGSRPQFESVCIRSSGPPWKIIGACRMELEKQPHLFIELAKDLNSEDFEIQVFGSGQLLKDMQEQSSSNLSKTKVSYFGWSSELKQKLLEAHFAVHFGKEEAFSLGLIEFLNASLPTLALNHTSISELITENSGILIDPNRFSDMASSIKNLACNLHERDKLGKQAFERSCLFSEKEWVKNTDALYQKLVGENL